MQQTVTIAVIAGTTRESRESIKAAQYIAALGQKLEDVEIIFVDPKEFTFPGDGLDDKDPHYSEITARADAFFIITPEYNHGYPGSLKRMLDSEYANYHRKPVALAGVSNGSWGGVRVCEALLPVCHRLGLVNIRSEVYFPKIQNVFGDDEQINPEYAAQYEQSVGRAFEELVWFARLLKPARN